MSTRALIHIYKSEEQAKDVNLKPFVTIYKHYDGYPDGGLGDDLKQICDKVDLDGMNRRSQRGDAVNCNGIECFAATLVAKMKVSSGDVYLYEPGSGDVWEEYVYTIFPGKTDGSIVLEWKEAS